ncbi:MAG: AI-2E family transporter [Micavibrio sp.]|nr:AI-2E family transporter [Micavibrio sp.]
MTTPKAKPATPVVASGYALGFIVIFLVVYIISLAANIMVPLVMAVFIWYLINAMARGIGSLSRYGVHVPRFLCFLLSIGVLLLGMWAIFELIRDNVSKVAAAAPVYQANFETMKPKVMALLGLDHIPTIPEIVQHIDLASILKYLAGFFTGIAGKTVEVLFFTGFLLYEQKYFNRKLVEMIEDHRLEDKIRHILRNIDIKIQRYIAVKTIISSLAGIATYIILSFFNEPFAAFWGLMAFFLHFIPYVGTFAAIALPSLMALVHVGDVTTFFTIGALLSVVLMLIGHILDPRLLGDTMNLSPIAIILSLAMWEMIWGVPGMFLAIPILAILVITMSQFEATRPFAILLSKTGVLDKPGKKDQL